MEYVGIIGDFASVLLVLGAFGSAIFLLCGKNCSRKQGAVCAAFIAGYVGMVSWNIAIEAEIEWNPSDIRDEEILGTWSDDRESMHLSADGTFSYRAGQQSFAGTWKRDDWNLYLVPKHYMRFVRHNGQCRLMTNLPEDMDGWKPHLGLGRVKKLEEPVPESSRKAPQFRAGKF